MNTRLSSKTMKSCIQACPLCSKPLTAGSSYTRHLTYCRKTKDRPKRRQRSCNACSDAKSKCSFALPCSRCHARGIQCAYDSRLSTLDQPSRNRQQQSTQAWAISPPKSHRSEEVVSCEIGPDLTFSGELFTPDWNLDIEFAWSDPVGKEKWLSRKPMSAPIAQHCATLILEELSIIPHQMLRRETFPPFIHPHWHQANLPEPLAICMQIARMFSTRTDETRPFIWRTIMSEQQRVLDKLYDLSARELLSALQAGMVYLIMRVVDDTPLTSGWSQWNNDLAVTQSKMCDRFLELCGGEFCQAEDIFPSLTWEDWIYAESRRRTTIAWFLISRCLLVKTKAGCPTTETPYVLPLNAPRLQWEARSSLGWMNELAAAKPMISRFEDLINAKQQADDTAEIQKTSIWRAETDQLGILLNIAAQGEAARLAERRLQGTPGNL